MKKAFNSSPRGERRAAASKSKLSLPLDHRADIADVDFCEAANRAAHAITFAILFLRENPSPEDSELLITLLQFKERWPNGTLVDAVRACAAGFDLKVRSNSDWDTVCAFYKIHKAATGHDSNCVETFIWDLIQLHMARPLTPAAVLERYKQFEDDFENAIATTRKFTKHYPEVVNPADPPTDLDFGNIENCAAATTSATPSA